MLLERWDAVGPLRSHPANHQLFQTVQSVKRRGVATAQFEALLLDELDVEATAMPEVPEEATDLRMWGMRKGSLASWCTSMRSSLR